MEKASESVSKLLPPQASASQPQGNETTTRLRNRNRILDAASRLLSAGERMSQLSIHRIASAADMSRATFYLHFKSKHDLIAALADREIGPWTLMLASALETDRITRDQIQQVAQGLLDVYRSNQGTVSGIIEMAEYDDETRRAWRGTIDGIAHQLENAIQRWRPGLTTTEANRLAQIIVWAGERFLHQEARRSTPRDDALLVWALTEMAWRLMSD